MDDDADSLVMSSPENYPRDMLVHQRSVSHDWTGKPLPFPLPTSQVSPHHDIAESPELATSGATGLQRGSPSSLHMEVRSQQFREAQRVGSLPPDGSSASSDCGSVVTMASSDVSLTEPATASARSPDIHQKQQQATVTCHEIATKPQGQDMAKVPEQPYQSRVGTGISTQMSKLQLQQQQVVNTSATGQDDRQFSQSKTKDVASQGSRPLTSGSRSKSQTPSQAFPILAGLTECNRQHSPKLPRAQMDTGASGYEASWHRVAGGSNTMDRMVKNPMSQYHEMLKNSPHNG